MPSDQIASCVMFLWLLGAKVIVIFNLGGNEVKVWQVVLWPIWVVGLLCDLIDDEKDS